MNIAFVCIYVYICSSGICTLLTHVYIYIHLYHNYMYIHTDVYTFYCHCCHCSQSCRAVFCSTAWQACIARMFEQHQLGWVLEGTESECQNMHFVIRSVLLHCSLLNSMLRISPSSLLEYIYIYSVLHRTPISAAHQYASQSHPRGHCSIFYWWCIPIAIDDIQISVVTPAAGMIRTCQYWL